MEAFAGIIGVIIGSLTSFFGTFYANKWKIENERELWNRQQAAEEKKLEIEKKKLEDEEKKLARSQLLEIYNNSIYFLTKFANERVVEIGSTANIQPFSDSEKQQLYLQSIKDKEFYFLETQKFLWLLSINLKDIEKSDLEAYEHLLKDFIRDFNRSQTIEPLGTLVIKFAKEDKRLKEGIINLNSAEPRKILTQQSGIAEMLN